MLMDNDKPIIDITLDNNFCSQSSYINAFKNKFGVTPIGRAIDKKIGKAI